MENERMISIRDLSNHYNVEVTFIHSLRDYGLITLIEEQNDHFVSDETLAELEMMMHLHYDLEINLEGLDAISHLLKRVKEMQKELNELRNKLG